MKWAILLLDKNSDSNERRNFMKKLFLTLCMLIATGAFLAAPAHAESVAVKKVVEVPGATKEQIIQKVRTWAGRYARDCDVKTGTITANGEIAYPSPPIDRIQYTFLFKMTNNIQNNKDTVTFEEVTLKAPVSYLPSDTGAGPTTIGGEIEPVKSKKDIEAANKVLNYIAVNLEDYLHNKTETTCPLERCKDCGVLSTSPDTMKEHVKGHGTAPKQ
jgi:hypothetical protein